MESKDTSAKVDLSRAKYVGFWKRVGAAIIDILILIVVTFPLLWWIYGPDYFTTPGMSKGVADVIINYVLPAVAVILFWRFRGATPGKMLISARIVDAASGGAPSTKQLIGRYFAYIVSSLPAGLGFLWIAFDKRKQSWHDKLAGTVVVYDKDDI
ncbi:MAG: RDD family protein [Betaproteobacteria bacterium]|nr:RDD family protein [Betaproteobacteria bacterium]